MPTDELEQLLLEAMPSGDETTETLSDVLEKLRGRSGLASMPAKQPQVTATSAWPSATAAPSANSSAKASDGVSSLLSTITGGWFGVFPLFSGIASLLGWGGDEPAAPQPLPKYVPPSPMHYEGAVSSTNPEVIYGLNYAANGMPRVNVPMGDFPGVQGGPPAAVNPQITIQVQAMDSRSFLDHSQEIARAVKEAILNSNSLNDVLNEL